jgi:hypothetical protein
MGRRAVVGVVLVATGCFPLPPKPPRAGEDTADRRVAAELGAVPAVAARVCVLRPAAVAGEVTMELRDNGRLVGATRGQTFACWLAAPGRHQITSVDDDTGPTYLDARAGRQYWLHQDVAIFDEHLHAHLDWVDEVLAAEMVDGCARVMVNVPGHESRTDAVAVAPAR